MPDVVVGSSLPDYPPDWVPLGDVPAWILRRYQVSGDVIGYDLQDAVQSGKEIPHRIDIEPRGYDPELPKGLERKRGPNGGIDLRNHVVVRDWTAAEADPTRATVGGWGQDGIRQRLPVLVKWDAVRLFVPLRLPRWKKALNSGNGVPVVNGSAIEKHDAANPATGTRHPPTPINGRDCPVKREDFDRVSDCMNHLETWGRWKYAGKRVPRREQLLLDFEHDFGHINGINEKSHMRDLKKILDPENVGGAPTHVRNDAS